MSTLRKLTASLLFALISTSAFAVTNAQVFAFAEANYPSIFTGAATTGQYQKYNFRYYPASGNYLAVDTLGEIFILGPYTGNVITSVGLATAYAPTITAWESAQGGGTTGGTTSGAPSGTSTANPFINSSWSGAATVTTSNTNSGCTSSTWTATIDSTGVLTGNTSSNCGDVAMLVGTVDSSGTASFGYAGGICTFSGQFSLSPASSASGTFTCSNAGESASGTWTGAVPGGSTSSGNTPGVQTAGAVSCQLSGSNAYITLCNTYGSHIKTSCSAGETTVASCSGTNTCTSTGSDSSWVTTNHFGGSMFSSVTSMYQSNCTAATGTWR